MPKGPDAGLPGGPNLLDPRATEDLESKRGSQSSNHAVNYGGDNWDLDSPMPGQLRQPRIVVRAERLLFFFDALLGGFHLHIV